MTIEIPIEYRIGDATRPGYDGAMVIAHVCNDIGGWGRGFVVALSHRWVEPEAAYRRWYRERDANDFRLGAIQLIQVEADIWVANIIGQRDVRRGPDGPPVRYEAIEEGLSTLADEAYAMGASIHMPRIGSGLAGGSWHVIESIVQRTLGDAGIPVVVYDLP